MSAEFMKCVMFSLLYLRMKTNHVVSFYFQKITSDKFKEANISLAYSILKVVSMLLVVLYVMSSYTTGILLCLPSVSPGLNLCSHVLVCHNITIGLSRINSRGI